MSNPKNQKDILGDVPSKPVFKRTDTLAATAGELPYNQSVYLRVEKIEKRMIAVGGKKTEVNEAFVIIAENLETNTKFSFIAGQVLVSILTETFQDLSKVVGETLEIVRTRQEGKRYDTFEVYRISVA